MGRMAPAMGLHGRCPIRPVYLPFSMEARMKNAKMAASSGRAEQLNAMITQVHVGRLTILDGSMLFVHADRDKLYRMVGEYMRSRPVIFPAARHIDWTTVPSDARSEEHTSALQAIMRNSLAVF